MRRICFAGCTVASLALGRFVFLDFQRANAKKQVRTCIGAARNTVSVGNLSTSQCWRKERDQSGGALCLQGLPQQNGQSNIEAGDRLAEVIKPLCIGKPLKVFARPAECRHIKAEQELSLD